jgi:cytoskeletal protein CcmA (bactofilin family)
MLPAMFLGTLLALAVAVPAAASDTDKVNGDVHVASGQTVGDVSSVNGDVRIDGGATVDEAETVNGSITLDRGADVAGRASNVNGTIHLDGAHVGGGLETVAGDIEVGADSRVEGGILVDKPNNGWFHFGTTRTPRVVIGPGAVVKGTLEFRREVDLYVSDRATIGEVKGATVHKFSGDQP